VSEWVTRGVRLITERDGAGPVAIRGDTVTYNVRLFLHRGDEVSFDAEIIARARSSVSVRRIDDCELIDHRVELGRRHASAGIEKALIGMRTGGFREVEIAPHLAYGDTGIPGRIPANALLRAQIWLRRIG